MKKERKQMSTSLQIFAPTPDHGIILTCEHLNELLAAAHSVKHVTAELVSGPTVDWERVSRSLPKGTQLIATMPAATATREVSLHTDLDSHMRFLITDHNGAKTSLDCTVMAFPTRRAHSTRGKRSN